jgi:hypothetical protein
VFFSHSKLTNSTFSHDFSAKRTTLCFCSVVSFDTTVPRQARTWLGFLSECFELYSLCFEENNNMRVSADKVGFGFVGLLRKAFSCWALGDCQLGLSWICTRLLRLSLSAKLSQLWNNIFLLQQISISQKYSQPTTAYIRYPESAKKIRYPEKMDGLNPLGRSCFCPRPPFIFNHIHIC